MSRTKSVMILVRDFPPVGTSGVYRVAGLCRYLVERGWRVTVITAEPSKNAKLDEQLLASVPKGARIVRTAEPNLSVVASNLFKPHRWFKRPCATDTKATRLEKKDVDRSPTGTTQTRSNRPRRRLQRMIDWFSWWLLVPDGCIGWLYPAVRAGLKEGRRARPDVVISSAPVWTAHLVGMVLSRLLRVPFVADFRDPWYGSGFRKNPYRAHRYANRTLERMVVRRAQRITCAWDGIRRHLALNHPGKARDMVTILNGFDPEAIDQAPAVRLDTERRVFLHTGNFYGPRIPIPLMEAARQFGSSERRSHQVLFVLAGYPFYGKTPLEEIVREYGVQDLVRVLPQLPHHEALGLMKGADAALLFGQSGEESLASVPGKAYEYIAACKPVLAVGAGTEVCEVIEKGGCPIWTASADEPDQIVAAVQEMVQFIDSEQNVCASDPEARSQFTRQAMAARIESVLSDVIVNETNCATPPVSAREAETLNEPLS